MGTVVVVVGFGEVFESDEISLSFTMLEFVKVLSDDFEYIPSVCPSDTVTAASLEPPGSANSTVVLGFAGSVTLTLRVFSQTSVLASTTKAADFCTTSPTIIVLLIVDSYKFVILREEAKLVRFELELLVAGGPIVVAPVKFESFDNASVDGDIV